MIPDSTPTSGVAHQMPRTCGDDPALSYTEAVTELNAPHLRG